MHINCPHCGAGIEAPDTLEGQTRPCPKCGGTVKIESAPESETDDFAQYASDTPPPETSDEEEKWRSNLLSAIEKLSDNSISHQNELIAVIERGQQKKKFFQMEPLLFLLIIYCLGGIAFGLNIFFNSETVLQEIAALLIYGTHFLGTLIIVVGDLLNR